MKKKYLLITLLSIALLTLTGCQSVEKWFKNAKEEWLGLEMTVRTYERKILLCSKSPWVSMRLIMWVLP